MERQATAFSLTHTLTHTDPYDHAAKPRWATEDDFQKLKGKEDPKDLAKPKLEEDEVRLRPENGFQGFEAVGGLSGFIFHSIQPFLTSQEVSALSVTSKQSKNYVYTYRKSLGLQNFLLKGIPQFIELLGTIAHNSHALEFF